MYCYACVCFPLNPPSVQPQRHVVVLELAQVASASAPVVHAARAGDEQTFAHKADAGERDGTVQLPERAQRQVEHPEQALLRGQDVPVAVVARGHHVQGLPDVRHANRRLAILCRRAVLGRYVEHVQLTFGVGDQMSAVFAELQTKRLR